MDEQQIRQDERNKIAVALRDVVGRDDVLIESSLLYEVAWQLENLGDRAVSFFERADLRTIEESV